MRLELKRVRYEELNARQQENYNYQKVSAVLADFGFTTMRLSDDWQGADFLAQHINGGMILKVQLKSRLVIDKKYAAKDLWVCFCNGKDWYMYPHDEMMNRILATTEVSKSESWNVQGGYSYPRLSKALLELLKEYALTEQ
jgi:frataxin-like iron-binding protein CyaY